jgi:2,3-bisphosphoglycerate-independent phosphoglycerate mutase
MKTRLKQTRESMLKSETVVLVIMDGWGHREATEHNAIHSARTPVWDRLWAERPHALIHAAEGAVGLPDSQMGNSEVGHLNLGAGRVVFQEFTRIHRAIESGEFFSNAALTEAVDVARAADRSVHILGLLSPGGVHSHEDQIFAMFELAAQRGAPRVVLHAFLDGRDTPPKSALESIRRAQRKLDSLGSARFGSVVGRYFAMDRDRRWERTRSAYDLICNGAGMHTARSAEEAVEAAYARGETDEFVAATAVVPPGAASVRVEDGDVIVVMNFRADRARQLTRAFIDPKFDGFDRPRVARLGRFVTLTEYQADFDVPAAFAPVRLTNVLGSYLSGLGKRQLRVAETEKYAHVTFFFNGGVEPPYPGEDRVLIPSPSDVPTYNLKPEMSAAKVAAEVVAAVREGKYSLIVCNFANPDMVGHTGDFDATVKAIEVVDRCLGEITAAVRETGAQMLITADHGNAEQMYDESTGQAHTAHTTNPVPLVYVDGPAQMSGDGALQDVAPTLLTLMDLPIPAEMTGRPLVRRAGARAKSAAGGGSAR